MKGHALRTAVITMVLVIKVLPLLSQNGLPRYGTEWKTVDRYQQQGLPKSALAEVRKIYALAKRDRQDAQLIRALIYMSILQSETREDNLLASIRELDREIQTAREPARSVLYSLQGDLYWGYFQQNRWKVYGRTRTEGNKSPDPATWDAAAFHRTIRTCYLRSLQDEKQLQQTRLEEFDAIIEKGNMRHLRPTLYDLLTDRALAYFENDERSISEPEQTFELNQIAAFAPAAEFSRYPFRSRDSLSLTYQALLLYQRWLQFHQNDPRPDAWIDTDLRRLSFVKNHSVLPDKKSLFMDALRRITDTYTDLPAAAEAWYRLAAQYEEDGITYKAFGDSTHRLDRLRARDICERVLRQKDSSEGRVHCQQLLRALKRPRFRFTMEQVNMPDKPFRTLVTYRNTDRLYFRLIPYPEKLKALLKDRADESYWSTLIATTSLRQWEQPLPQPGDLQEHSTEIRIESLPTGAYLLLASSTADFNIQSALLGARVFHVSSISYVNRDEHLFVLDRESGEPMTGATVQVWTERYDYAQNKYVRVKDIRLQSDSNGYVRLQRPADNARMSYLGRLFEITFRNDHFFPDDLVYDYSSYNQEENEPGETLTVHLFTDRSIYRPGQSVQFKGIVLTQRRKERSGTVKSGHSVQVLLRDANYRTIDTLALRSNDYGSFQGVFQLPSAGLNGSFQIYTATGNGSVSFRMEEYKRPKFYVEYEPVTGQYRVDDSLTVTGRAKGYSGNTIDGASVKYRVVREPRFPYPWLCRRWWQPPSEAREIVHGVTKTDKEGRFTIGFRAIPDASIDTRFEPVFDYRIYADVTDINGETRSGEGQVSAGYKSFVLETTLPSTAPADSFRQLTIRTRNLSGTYVPTQVTVTLMKLKAENRLVRDRLWDRPDQFVMNKSDYLHHFPYDLYANETDPFEWDQESILYKATEPSRADGSWILSGNRPLPGTYRLDITAVNERGEMVRDQHIIRLTNATGYPADQSDYLWTGNIRATAEPGDTAGLELGTSAGKIFVIEQVKKSRNEEDRFLFRSLSDKKLTVRIPVTEKDRGGFGASWMFVRHNRLWQYNQLFQVPWNNKELKMEYVSYREKTLPGAAEIWKLRITGAKKEAAAAELMAAMYDASLDQFTAHGWSPPSIWPYFYGLGQWNGHSNFTAVGSLVKDLPEPPLPSVEKNFDRLILSDQLTNTDYLYRRVVGLTAGAPPPTEEVRIMADSAAVTKNENEIVRQKEASVMKKNKEEGQAGVRKDFRETAFFFPYLRTDSTGAVEFRFTMPEALTRWKFMALAHTQDAAFGYTSREVITQKDLMVQPNPPRFLREGDRMEFSSKLVNLTGNELTGTAQFRVFDAETREPLDSWFKNAVADQYFTVPAGESEAVRFPIEVPFHFNRPVVWQIIATAGDKSDGEENTLPVLTNRMLVTESLPLAFRGTGTRNFNFLKLLRSDSSETLQHKALTVEYTSDPIWYAVQSLPYLMEFPYECAEQTWNRYYANALGTHLTRSMPGLTRVLGQWKGTDTSAFLSNLQKNESLRSILLEETPWILQARNESEQKRRVALLLDLVRMKNERTRTLNKLRELQSSNGGFVWFTGGPDDRYITQYILTGIGHLIHLKAVDNAQQAELDPILTIGLPYLDRMMKEDYDQLLKGKTDRRTYVPSAALIQYLYMRSFFPDRPLKAEYRTAFAYFRSRIRSSWLKQDTYMKGMIALTLHRSGDTQTAAAILRSLRESAIVSEESGMYWKVPRAGWFWHESPIERQALLIETFTEVGRDNATADELRSWLLQHKQTNSWSTTRATAEACYALLLRGTDWLQEGTNTTLQLGNLSIRSEEIAGQAGTGYLQQVIEGDRVKSEMGNITVAIDAAARKSATVSWGAVHWQYFEDLDKITPAKTPLELTKKLFIEQYTPNGPTLTPVTDETPIRVGDRIVVRMELRTDRDMEYVHLKDMRASGLEPIQVLSGYEWKNGLGYYATTRDAATHFFISWLGRGTYVFDYSLVAAQSGIFSNGITSIQCQYAPEFSAHSEGIRITIEQ